VKFILFIFLVTSQLVYAQNTSLERNGAVGVRFSRNADGMILIKNVQQNSPAAQAGLAVNDLMMSVDGKNLQGMESSDITNLLRGKVGSSVDIKLLSADSGKEYLMTIQRQQVSFTMPPSSPKVEPKKSSQLAAQGDEKLAGKRADKSTNKTVDQAASSSPAEEKKESNPNNAVYFIQTGTFFSKETANEQSASFAQKGYTSFVDPANISGNTVYRVRIGPFENKSGADALSKKLTSQAITNSIIEVLK
jgi:cell division protein FtsN